LLRAIEKAVANGPLLAIGAVVTTMLVHMPDGWFPSGVDDTIKPLRAWLFIIGLNCWAALLVNYVGIPVFRPLQRRVGVTLRPSGPASFQS
jgi:hypothetical protein